MPDELLGSLVDVTSCLHDPELLRRVFADDGSVLLRDVLPRDDVLAARREVFFRLAGTGEIQYPVEAGIATGTRLRRELFPDLRAFWKSVSEGAALRRVTHGP